MHARPLAMQPCLHTTCLQDRASHAKKSAYGDGEQDEAIAAMVDIMRVTGRKQPSTLFVVGSYHIGKERAYLGAAAALGWKVWCPAAKRNVSACWLLGCQCLSAR